MDKPDIFSYLSTMALADQMLEKKLIGRKDFLAFEESMREKYGLVKNSIYRDRNLLAVPARGNIAQCGEVAPCRRKQ